MYRSLDGDEELYYKQYRNNQRYIHNGKEFIDKTRIKIKKLQKEISDKENQLKIWKGKMMEGYSVIGYLGDDYDFNCSVNLRVCSQIKMNFFAQNLREVSANLVKNFDTVFF